MSKIFILLFFTKVWAATAPMGTQFAGHEKYTGGTCQIRVLDWQGNNLEIMFAVLDRSNVLVHLEVINLTDRQGAYVKSEPLTVDNDALGSKEVLAISTLRIADSSRLSARFSRSHVAMLLPELSNVSPAMSATEVYVCDDLTAVSTW